MKENKKKYVTDEKGDAYVHENDVIRHDIKDGNIDGPLLDYKVVVANGCVGYKKKGVPLYKCTVCCKKVAKSSLRMNSLIKVLKQTQRNAVFVQSFLIL